MGIENQFDDFMVRSVDPYAHAKYDVLLKWLGNIQGLSILVVGSGSGEFAAYLAQNGAVVTAFDIDEASIALTRSTCLKLGVQLTTLVSTIESFKPKSAFDIVAATDVIEHIADDTTALCCLFSFTKANGRVLVTVPALSFLFGHHDRILGHFRRYSKSSMASVVAAAAARQGFSFIFLRKRYFGFFLIPVTLILSRWMRRPYPIASVGGSQNKVVRLFLKLIFKLEKRISPPLGTSLLTLIQKPG
jgi:SAM-dependent methyltransferase